MITKHLTKHIYFNSPIESDDHCGTCNGANCDVCRAQYEVEGITERFYDPEKAKKAEEELKAENDSLFPEVPGGYSMNSLTPEYTVIDDLLYIQLWKRASFKGDTDWGYRYLLCNMESPVYNKELEKAKERMDKYTECVCDDKDKDIDECSKMGCRDSSCYKEMKSGRRKEKKWYM